MVELTVVTVVVDCNETVDSLDWLFMMVLLRENACWAVAMLSKLTLSRLFIRRRYAQGPQHIEIPVLSEGKDSSSRRPFHFAVDWSKGTHGLAWVALGMSHIWQYKNLPESLRSRE